MIIVLALKIVVFSLYILCYNITAFIASSAKTSDLVFPRKWSCPLSNKQFKLFVIIRFDSFIRDAYVALNIFDCNFLRCRVRHQITKAHMSPPHKHITILKIPCGLISTRQPWLWWHKGLPFINYNTIERKFQYNVMTSKSCNYPSNYASQKTKNKSPWSRRQFWTPGTLIWMLLAKIQNRTIPNGQIAIIEL